MERHSVTVFVWVFVLFISSIFAQTALPKKPAEHAGAPTTWQAIASRIPGGLDARRIAHLEQEWQVAEVEPNLLKMTNNLTGVTKYVDISNLELDLGKLSANTQVIDLINVDTTLYNRKYKKKNMFPIGSLSGYPMTIGDFNQNGKLDLAGSYNPLQNFELADCAIAELEDSVFVIKKVYVDSVETALTGTDVDNDGLLEINFKWKGQKFANIEQKKIGEYPDTLNFLHRMWEFGAQVASETFTDMDGDTKLDVIYEGTDSTEQCCHQVFVAEYDSATNNFVRKFGVIPTPDWGISGFGVGDLDNDGSKEFATGSVSFPAHIYMWENTGNDSYAQVYQDTMRIANAYMTTVTNDMDNNSKIELFLGGSSYSGGLPVTRIYWFESEDNNIYRKVRSFLLLGTEVLGTTELYKHDVNNDGVDDLVFSFSFSIAMLIWNNTIQAFDLFYYDSWEKLNQEIQSINMHKVFDGGKLDLFVNVKDLSTAPRIRTYFYRPNTISGISPTVQPFDNFILHQNYPNPFNGTTRIRFQLPAQGIVTLTIYDILGKEVARLIDQKLYAPDNYETVWNGANQNGKEVSSGIYFYELIIVSPTEQREVFKQNNKMLFIK